VDEAGYNCKVGYLDLKGFGLGLGMSRRRVLVVIIQTSSPAAVHSFLRVLCVCEELKADILVGGRMKGQMELVVDAAGRVDTGQEKEHLIIKALRSSSASRLVSN